MRDYGCNRDREKQLRDEGGKRMIIKVSMPGQFRLKMVPAFKSVLFPKEGEVHYIGGADVLPAPLGSREEAEVLKELGTERDAQAKSRLIEHNLRLVVYIAKKV